MDYRLDISVGSEQLSEKDRQTAVDVTLAPEGVVHTNLPLHVVFCVDTSSSMKHGPLATAKDGLVQAASRLSADDRVGVVEFSRDANIILDPVAGSETAQIESAVTNLEASGKTNLTEGLATSRTLLSQIGGASTTDTDTISRIVLLTDGKPNLKSLDAYSFDDTFGGASDERLNAAVGAELNQEGITVHSAGVGSYDASVLDALSDKSGGEWRHLTSPDEIDDFLETQVADARSITGTNPILELTTRNGTTINNIAQKVPNVGEPTVEEHGDRYVIHAADISTDKPPQYTFDATVPNLDSGLKTLVDIDLTVGEFQTSDSVEVKFVLASLQDENAGEGWVEREHGEITGEEGIIETKDDMDKSERDEATSGFITRRD